MQDSELERKFFDQFIPQIIHPKTDLPLRLFNYQADAIHKFFKNDINVWNMGRQVGKTSDAALLLAFLSQECRGDAVIASFRMEQSTDIIDWTKAWCRSCKDPTYAENITNDAAIEICFKTGFHCIAMPHGHAARGKSTIIVITDESELIDDQDLTALLPTGLATEPKRLHMGTVWGTNSWWWQFIQHADERHYALSLVTSEQALQPNGPIIRTQLDLLREEIGDLQYQQECLLRPIPDVDVFFGADLVKSCLGERV
jgi:hypothetical protein